MVAAGATSDVSSTTSVFAFLTRGFFGAASAPSTFGFATRLGLTGSSGSSRPLPSFVRSSLASFESSGVMARTPLCPISSAASIRSLLVTPSSFARSMTFIFAAGTVASPPRDHRVDQVHP
jgi:hypothetical protein